MSSVASSGEPHVLVIGAAGAIGRRVTPGLGAHCRLHLADLRPDETAVPRVAPLDICDYDAVLAAVRDMDAVVHLAIAHPREMRGWSRHAIADAEMRVNMLGTQHVLDAAHRQGVKRVVYISSLTTVLGSPRLERIERDTPPRPTDLYACTKLFGEQLGEMYAREKGLSVICLRLGHPYTLQPIAGPADLAQPSHRAHVVSMADITQAIRRSLAVTDVPYALVNIVSDSDRRNVDLSAAEQVLGYQPRDYFTADGPIARPSAIERP